MDASEQETCGNYSKDVISDNCECDPQNNSNIPREGDDEEGSCKVEVPRNFNSQPSPFSPIFSNKYSSQATLSMIGRSDSGVTLNSRTDLQCLGSRASVLMALARARSTDSLQRYCHEQTQLEKLDNSKESYLSLDDQRLYVKRQGKKLTGVSVSKEKSLFLFKIDNPIRRVCLKVAVHNITDILIVLVILVNCVFIALNDPPEAADYLRDPWNWLDFVVVLLGYLALIPSVGNYSSVRTFRVFRALRTITSIPGLRTMVNSLIRSLKPLIDVVILCVFFMFVFAIMGVQLFGGVLRQKCVSETTGHIYMPFGTPVVCGNSSTALHCPNTYYCSPSASTTTVPDNPNFGYTSFDDFGHAFLTILQLITLDFWEDVYNKTIEAVGVAYVPFFIVMVFFGSFFMLNLVLAVVAMSYEAEMIARSVEKERESHYEAQNFIHLNRYSNTKPIDDDTSSLNIKVALPSVFIVRVIKVSRSQCRHLVRSSLFGRIVVTAIVLNTLALAIEYPGMNDTWLNVLHDVNLAFTIVFIIEMVLKLYGLGFREYVKHAFNIFDAIIVLTSIIELALPGNDSGVSVLRAFRLLRILKLAKNWRTMRDLINIIGASIGALGNLPVILLIVVYIFAVFGMQLFRGSYTIEKFGSEEDIPKWNFSDFWHSFMVIFRILCGEWIESLWEAMFVSNDIGAAFFYVVVLCVGYFIILNLFLALLLNSFSEFGCNDKNSENTESITDGEDFDEDDNGRDETIEEESKNESNAKEARLKNRCFQYVIVKIKNMRSIIQGSNIFRARTMNCSNSSTVAPNVEVPLRSGACNTVMENDVHHGENVNTDSIDGTKPLISSCGSIRHRTSSFGLTNLRTRTSEDTIDEELRAKIDQANRETAHGERLTKMGMVKVGNGSTEVTGNFFSSEQDQNLLLGRDKAFLGMFHSITNENIGDSKINLHSKNENNTSSMYTVYDHIQARVRGFVETPVFEYAIILVIVISSFTLCFEDSSLRYKPGLKKSLDALNLVFAIIFTIEMILKMIGYGMLGYFDSKWNWLDFGIVVISIISTATVGNDELTALRAIRTLRALRPLRAISRLEGMRIVVNALLGAIPSIANVLMVCFIFWLIFSILGVQFFGGRFGRCVDAMSETYSATIVVDKISCLALSAEAEVNATIAKVSSMNATEANLLFLWPLPKEDTNLTSEVVPSMVPVYRWTNSKINFDNVGEGLLALFQVATYEGWMEVMHDAVDSTGYEKQPIPENTFYAYLFFVMFIIVGSFFTLNLFIGVIIDNFNRLRNQADRQTFLTESQRRWLTATRQMMTLKPYQMAHRPSERLRGRAFDLIQHTGFEIAVSLTIVANLLSMAMEHYDPGDNMIITVMVLNIMFAGIFLLEAALKLWVLRIEYFKKLWNIFDFFVVVVSVISVGLDFATYNVGFNPTILRVIRVFRVGRILRVIKSAKGVRKLLMTLIYSLYSLINVGSLLLLVMFIFTILGMALFGDVKWGVHGVNEKVNFSNFGYAMLTLFHLSTAAGWNDVLQGITVSEPHCDINALDREGNRILPNGNCGNQVSGSIYFIAYVLITFMIIVNMYIAVILENFQMAAEDDEESITESDFEHFIKVWVEFDPDATQMIAENRLREFLITLDLPLGIPGCSNAVVAVMNIPLYEDGAHFLDVLRAVLCRQLGNYDLPRTVKISLENKFLSRFPTLSQLGVPTTDTCQVFGRECAATTIQRSFRAYLRRRNRSTAAKKIQYAFRAYLKKKDIKIDIELSRNTTREKILEENNSFKENSNDHGVLPSVSPTRCAANLIMDADGAQNDEDCAGSGSANPRGSEITLPPLETRIAAILDRRKYS